ncbi:S1 family peptidase [Saccharopolyspora hattusasensis]|uniref:S1 family peptidase n=1 Tax=Saccharopolyspora hattusasensis TaxID=1128679 RepID=UPI003D98D5F1
MSASQPRELQLTEIIGMHDAVDLALLWCAPDGPGGAPRMDPLPIARAPGVRSGTKVYVVGYPAADSRRNDPEEMQRIFAGGYNVKRLQPGEVRSASGSVIHDCSTLGGNSGSCLFDLIRNLDGHRPALRRSIPSGQRGGAAVAAYGRPAPPAGRGGIFLRSTRRVATTRKARSCNTSCPFRSTSR